MVFKPKFEVSTRKGKKYMVRTPSGRLVHFGDANNEHYKDTTGVKGSPWPKKNHNDKERLRRFRKRSAAILRRGRPAYMDRESPMYYSWKYLWGVQKKKK